MAASFPRVTQSLPAVVRNQGQNARACPACSAFSSQLGIGRWAVIDPGHLLSRRRGETPHERGTGLGGSAHRDSRFPVKPTTIPKPAPRSQDEVWLEQAGQAAGRTGRAVAVARPLMSARRGRDYCGPSVISPVSRFTTPRRVCSRGVVVPRRMVDCTSRV